MTPPAPPSQDLKDLHIVSSPPSSPSGLSHTPEEDLTSTSPSLPPQAAPLPPPTEEQRTAALQRELQLLKSMNSTLTNLHDTLSTSKTNLKTLQTTISSSAVLLDTWTRILSQAEHNARLISDPAWEGAGEDAVLAEREESERKARIEKEREERERKERERAISSAMSSEKASTQAEKRGGSSRGTGRVLAGGRRGVPGPGQRGGTRGRGRA